MPVLNESGSGREIGGSNQSDVEVVNSSQLLNMLKSCSGCLVTIKNPMHNVDMKNDTGSKTTLQEQNSNSTVDGLYVTNQTKTSMEKAHENDTMVLISSPNLNQSQSGSVSELGDMLRKCEGCYVENNYSKKKSHAHTHSHHQQQQMAEDVKKAAKHKKVKGSSTEDFELTTVDQSIQPPETPEIPGNIPYGESETSAINEVPQLDRNETRETPGDLVLAVENLSDEELGKTTETTQELRKRKGENRVSFNYSDVTQEKENERIRGEESFVDNNNFNNNNNKNINNNANEKFEHFEEQHETEKKHTDGKKKKRSKCKGKQLTCSEKHASDRVSMKEQKYLNNSIAQAEAVFGELKNLTDNFNELNSTSSFSDIDDMKEEFTKQRSEVEPAELRSMIDKNDVRLIDLREDWELTHEGRISKAVNIPSASH